MAHARGTKGNAITREDVALDAGVSGKTVSLALRGDPRVKTSTRNLIRMLAKQINYHPQASARALRAGRTHTIGVIFSRLREFDTKLIKVYAASLQSITEALVQHHYHLSLAAVSEISMSKGRRRRPRLFTETALDGALVFHQPFSELAEVLADQSLPYVVIDGDPAPGRVCVYVDECRSAELAVEHLAALGHKRIALTAMAGADRYRCRQFVKGYMQGMVAAGLPVIPGWDKSRKSDTLGIIEYFETLFNRPNPPTALIAYHDQEAISVISWLAMHRKAVPRDVSVVALYDIGYGYTVETSPSGIVPSITCKAEMQEQMVLIAVQKLLHLIERPGEAMDSVVLEPKLIVRGSSGPCQD